MVSKGCSCMRAIMASPRASRERSTRASVFWAADAGRAAGAGAAVAFPDVFPDKGPCLVRYRALGRDFAMRFSLQYAHDRQSQGGLGTGAGLGGWDGDDGDPSGKHGAADRSEER